MKQSNILKRLSFFLVTIASVLALTSCSSDKDEPEDSSDLNFPVSTVPYTEIPGTWIIESIKDSETGKTVIIDQEITIGSFQPDKSLDEISDLLNYHMWSTGYDELISYVSDGEIMHSDVVFSFYKEKIWSFDSSRVGMMSFGLSTKKDGQPFIQSFVLTGLSLSNGVLTSASCLYGTNEDLMNPIRGTITLKKK